MPVRGTNLTFVPDMPNGGFYRTLPLEQLTAKVRSFQAR